MQNSDKQVKETLFWKVWKNIYLVNKIFDLIYSNDRQGVYNYHQITSVEWILVNGYNGLLIDKIYNGCDLDFYKPFGNKSSLELIFKHLQLKENNEFLINLFSNYQHYFNPSIRECINISIQCDCKNAFIIILGKVTEMEGNIEELVIELFKYSIYQNSFTIATYLNEIYGVLIRKELDIFTTGSQDKCNEFWKDLLLVNKEMVEQDDSKTMDINQRVDFLVNSLNVQLPTIGIQEFYYLYSVDIQDILLIDLVHCNLIIDKLKYIFKPYIDNPPKSSTITNSIFKIIGNHCLSYSNMLTYDQLVKMEFTDKELYTTVKCINSRNKNVELLFINLLPFTKNQSIESDYGYSFESHHQFQTNFYFYQNKYKFNSPKLQVSINSSSYHYGNYENVKLNSEWKIKDNSNNTIFEYVKYEPDIQIQFIKHAISDILNPSIPIDNKYTLNTLYGYLLEFDDLNLIKLLFKQCNQVYSLSTPCQFLESKIKSIETFDYLINEYQKEMWDYPVIMIDSLISKSKNSIILNHFKNKYNQLYLESLDRIDGSYRIEYSKKRIPVLQFICENIFDFKDHFNLISNWLRVSLYNCNELQEYKTIVFALLSIGQSYNYYDFGLFEYKLEHGKILNWLVESRYNDIEIGICKFDSIEIPLIYYYFRGLHKFNEKLQCTTLQYLKKCDLKILLHQIGKIGDTSAMESIFSRLKQFELDYFTFDKTKRTPNDNCLSDLTIFKEKSLRTVISSAAEFGKVEFLSFLLDYLKRNNHPISHCNVEFDFSLVKFQCYTNGNIRIAQFLNSNNQTLPIHNIENIFLLNYLNSIKK